MIHTVFDHYNMYCVCVCVCVCVPTVPVYILYCTTDTVVYYISQIQNNHSPDCNITTEYLYCVHNKLL